MGAGVVVGLADNDISRAKIAQHLEKRKEDNFRIDTGDSLTLDRHGTTRQVSGRVEWLEWNEVKPGW